jgi:MoaA/NifB/PqqE/SkfB family radical SAM enzyme
MNSRKLLRQVAAGVDVLRRPEAVESMPYTLVVGTTTACPLDCIMCSRSSVITEASRLGFAEYKGLIDTMDPLHVSVGDLGESLFDPDLDQKIRYAKGQGAGVDVVTSYAISRFAPEALVGSGLDVLKVSIDGATRETYEAIRGQPYFADALAHARGLIETRDRQGSQTPYVHLQFVVQQRNWQEIVEYVRLAAEIGADRIDYKPLLLGPDLEHREALVGDMTAEYVYALLQEADHLANRLGMRTNAPVLPLRTLRRHWAIYNGAKSRSRDLGCCILPWVSTYIAADGGVYGCCNLRFWDDGLLGNIYEDEFASVWNGEAYQELRRHLRDGHSPFRTCYTCYPQSMTDTSGYRYLATMPKLRLFKQRR